MVRGRGCWALWRPQVLGMRQWGWRLGEAPHSCLSLVPWFWLVMGKLEVGDQVRGARWGRRRWVRVR